MADCSELSENLTKIAMNLATREDIQTLDDVVLAMKEFFPMIRRQDLVDAIVESTTRQSKEVDDLVKKLRSIKQEARSDKALQDKIAELEGFLEGGKLPPANKKQSTATDATQALRSILFDLRKQLNRSEPARRKRLEKSIADLEQKLQTGDIMPKPKPPQAESKELDRLIFKRDSIKQEIRDEIRNLKPMTIWGRAGATWDLARLLMTTGELSFGLRQGGIYAFSHPLKWSSAMVKSFKSFGSAKSLYDINKEIFARENAPNYQKSGLAIIHEGMSLTRSEEVTMNYWMDKTPVLRNFNRAAIGFFNTMRADMFDMGYQTLGRSRTMTQAEMEVWANYINVMSGRGKLSIGSISLEPAALAMNRMFFSARYVASRFQILTGQPLWTQTKSGPAGLRIRGQIAKEYIRLGLGLATVFALGMVAGADIEEDPRSSNFGKLKFGNRRLDVMMGHAQIVRLMAQLMTGKTKTGRDEIVALRGPDKRYGARDIQDVIADFGRSKLSPQLGFMMNLITGETMTGEEVTLLNSVSQMIYPITYGDIYEVMQQEGMPTNVSLTILTLLGMGLQTYDANKSSYAATGGILGI